MLLHTTAAIDRCGDTEHTTDPLGIALLRFIIELGHPRSGEYPPPLCTIQAHKGVARHLSSLHSTKHVRITLLRIGHITGRARKVCTSTLS